MAHSGETSPALRRISMEATNKSRSIGKYYRLEGLSETDDKVNREITLAFREHRAFSVFPDAGLCNSIRNGEGSETTQNRIREIRDQVMEVASDGDLNLLQRFRSDVRLNTRLFNAIDNLHRALARIENQLILERRFVIIKERHGISTLYQEYGVVSVLAHVGSGEEWHDNPTIYLGLQTFDLLRHEKKGGRSVHFDQFRALLETEERAIETGFYHSDPVDRVTELGFKELIRALDEYVSVDYEETPESSGTLQMAAFTDEDRGRLLQLLDARRKDDMLHFDYDSVVRGMDQIEELARHYKQNGSESSLREVIRLLVSASGHDLHEIRNRANIALERVFSPKEYDAPPASRFLNTKVGESWSMDFRLPSGNLYFLRIYEIQSEHEYNLENRLVFTDVPLVETSSGQFTVDGSFTKVGQVDFLVYRQEGKEHRWVSDPGTSGRINVMPDVAGEVILEIFTDIHGHARTYWKSGKEHPGLVYNENGEVIRLGRFSDVTAHLEDIKNRYLISAIYLLGVQTRGSHSEDWAQGATSPSPFSPMSLTTFEEYLGGEAEFRALVEKAHELDIKIIVDIIPHLNRHSRELPDEYAVRCYDGDGGLVYRASTDGRYGSWDDGRLLNYRMFEVWEWLSRSICKLVEDYGVDGIRFDSAHAVPIMMKRNNFPFIYDHRRTHEEMVEGRIIVNDREYGHYVTTGYFDSACRDLIAVPTHYYLMQMVERSLRKSGKSYFINLAECYWGHERFLSRSGVIPYNSALFKICENIMHGKSDVRELYHVYDWYFPASLPPGSEMLGILGNHDERRALNTFGHRGLRAAVGFTVFMSNIVMDYEGSAEGEGWKVFLDNIYVNWNQFEYASHRSLEGFYREWHEFHQTHRGKGHIVWANNHMVAAAVRFSKDSIWIGAFNFSDFNQSAAIQFDNPSLPIDDSAYYILEDPLYSPLTDHYNHFTGRELRTEKINTIVSYTERTKLLCLRKIQGEIGEKDGDFIKDSFFRLCRLPTDMDFSKNYACEKILDSLSSYSNFESFIEKTLIPLFQANERSFLELGLKRALFFAHDSGLCDGNILLDYINQMKNSSVRVIQEIGGSLSTQNLRGPIVFLAAEAEPFSRSGGLGNVVFELPREMVNMGEEVCVITGLYRGGDDKARGKMEAALKEYDAKYSGVNVAFKIMDQEYQVGVHTCLVEGVRFYLLDHFELFDGLYWGVTGQEKLRRRIGFARAAAEVIRVFGINPGFTMTNDAYTGLFNGIVRSDHFYTEGSFRRNTFLHMIHNGGWQYFDAYHRFENGFDLFSLFNLPGWRSGEFMDPIHGDRVNCMASGIRFADRVVTVSPSYAKQIEHACDGLEHILFRVIGISNAIGRDFKVRIQKRFKDSGFMENGFGPLLERIEGDGELHRKIKNELPEILKGSKGILAIKDELRRGYVARSAGKMILQMNYGFDIDPERVLVTMIHRITEQKGFQLLLEASEGIFKHLNIQAIIGGSISSGDKKGEEIAHGLWQLSTYYPGQINLQFGFQDISIPLLTSDIFCMPSMNEPGGISQLEAFEAGNLVVARATGGLRDTVSPVQVQDGIVEGNGFLFYDYSAHAFYDAMERAVQFFAESDVNTIIKIRQKASQSAYYWDRPARQYIQKLYRIKEMIRMIQ